MINTFFQRTELEGQSKPMALDIESIHPQTVPEAVCFESERVLLASEEDSENKKQENTLLLQVLFSQ